MSLNDSRGARTPRGRAPLFSIGESASGRPGTNTRVLETFWGYVFLVPAVAGFLVFTAFPIVMSFYYSLTKYDGLTAVEFIGLQNYVRLLGNSEFMLSLWNTVYFALGTVPTGTLLSLVVAVALNRRIRFVKLYRTAFFLPVVVSLVSVSMIWQWMYQKDYGLINVVLGWLHLYQPPWLGSEHWAMPSLMIMNVWKNIGFNAVIFLAGLQGIPRSVYEAADLDGANVPTRFFRITVPLIGNTTVFVVIMSLIKAFQQFDSIYIMTGGGPEKSTQVVSYLIYMNAFQFFKQGRASAMAYILFLIIFVFTVLQMRTSDGKNA